MCESSGWWAWRRRCMLKSRGAALAKSGKHSCSPLVARMLLAMTRRLLSLTLLVATACALSSCAIPEGISYLAKAAHERLDKNNASAAPAPAAAPASSASSEPPVAFRAQEPPPPEPTAQVPRPSVKVEQLP